MDRIKKNRFKNFAILVLLLALLLLIGSGFYSYNIGLETQRMYFSEVGYHFTDLIDKAFNGLIEEDAERQRLISKNRKAKEYCMDADNLMKTYHAELLLKKEIISNNNIQYSRIESYENGHFVESYKDENLKYQFESIDQEMLNDHAYIVTDVITNDTLSSQLYVIASPIRWKSKVIGVVYSVYDFSLFSKLFINNVEFGDTGYVFLVETGGHLLDHPFKNEIASLKKDAEITVKDILSVSKQKQKIVISQFRGKDKYYYVKNIALNHAVIKKPLYVIFTQDEEEIFDHSRAHLGRILAVIALVILLFIVAVMLSGHWFTQLITRDVNLAFNKNLDKEVNKRTKKLRKLAEADSLTKLYNHGAVIKRIEKEVSISNIENKVFSILMIDIDHFKSINDSYGHPIGDEVLVKIAALLRFSIRECDIVGRYGGEEFIMMLRNTESDEAFVIADRIRQRASEMEFSDYKIKLTISIGVAQWQNKNANETVKEADRKLYESKSSGRNKTTK